MIKLEKMLNWSKLQKYFVNASWLISEKVFSLFISMVVGIYVARYLQPANFGLLNYAISFVALFSSFSALGIDNILIRELSKTPEKRDEIMGTGFMLKLFGSSFVVLLITVVLLLGNHDSLTSTLIMVITGAELFKAFEVVNSFYQSKVMSKNVVRVQIVVNLIGNVVRILLVYFQAPLIWFPVVIALNGFFNAVGYIYTYRTKDGSPFRWFFEKKMAYMLLRESWPITLQGMAMQTQARIDQVMLGDMLNNYEVGQYSVAMRFIEMFGFIPMMLLSTFAPAVTRAKQTSHDLYTERIVNFYRLMFLLFLCTAIPIFLFGEKVVVLLYGAEYQAGGYLLSLFSLRLLFANVGVGKSMYVVNESLFKNSLLNAVVGAIVNISINYFLIPIYGTIGAFIATIVSFSVSVFVVDSFFAKTRQNQKMLFKGVFTFWKIGALR